MPYLVGDLPGEAVQIPEPNKKIIFKVTYLAEITPVVERSRNQRRVMKNPRCFATGYTSTDLTEITPAVERSRNQRGDVCPFPEASQALKEKPLTPLSGDIRDLPEATATRIARDFDCVDLDYNAFYPGGLRLRSATVVHCNECRIEGRSLSGAEGRSLSCVEGYALYV
ncbi:MAG: hypothetical protein C0424_00305 [Sphingobacteriaceae bacterium]|nr:hypothetical protein [Sphingobacteriaceae bacterium]